MKPPRAVVVQISNFGSVGGVQHTCLTALRASHLWVEPADLLFHREFLDDHDGADANFTVRRLSFRTEQIAEAAA